jgi:GT2 family glycosyltransferase
LEAENRAVRDELDLVLSSKGRRLLLAIGHPVFTLSAAMRWLLCRQPAAAVGELWRDFFRNQIPLSSIAPRLDAAGTSAQTMQWTDELGINGEVHEALLCTPGHSLRFRFPVGPRPRLRAYCAVLPRCWDVYEEGVEFRATVKVGPTVGRAARRLIPSQRWSDRRWRPLAVTIPEGVAGEAEITLEITGPQAAAPMSLSLAWGDLVVEWPRSAAERRQLLQSAARRVRQWGIGGMLGYARGRHRIDDQAAAYRRWVDLHRLDQRGLEQLRHEVEALAYKPLISVITPVHNTAPGALRACFESVQAQAYRSWEHCVVDDGSTAEETREVLRRHADHSRVRLARSEQSQHVSRASNAALSLAVGEYVVLLDHDDELTPDALAEIVRLLNAHPEADVIYSDEDKLDESGARCDPYFKPDWSPELLLSYMYACHVLVVRRRLVEEIGGFREGFEGAQDYDLLLRLIEKTDRIYHMPRILYHWRKSAASTASAGSAKPWAIDAGRRALEDYARRSAIAGEVVPGPSPGMYRLKRSIRGEPLVSVVIPTTGKPHGSRGDLLAKALSSLKKTSWRNLEVIVSADGGELSGPARQALEELPHSVLDYRAPGSFNFAHKINRAVQQSRGEHVVLFNDDLEVVSPEWLTAMLEHSQSQSVGAVGAKLVYPDGRLQHVGMLIGVSGLTAHAFHRHPGKSPGYFGSAVVSRNCSAVTAACLMTRRAVFDEVGGLDEQFPVDFNDVDFCLRVRSAGYRIVFTPYAELIHHESSSFGNRTQSSTELARMRQRWGAALDIDPYYNPNLSRLFSDYRVQV